MFLRSFDCHIKFVWNNKFDLISASGDKKVKRVSGKK
jgi:hypothetical protein